MSFSSSQLLLNSADRSEMYLSKAHTSALSSCVKCFLIALCHLGLQTIQFCRKEHGRSEKIVLLFLKVLLTI